MKIKRKSDIVESKYIIDKDNYDDVKHDLKDDDVVKIVDEEDETKEDEVIEETNRAIITKKDLIKVIKENYAKKL